MTGGCAWRTQSFFSCSAQKRNAVRMHGYKLRIVWRCGRQAGGEACCCAAQLSVTDSKSSLRVSACFTSAATKRFKSAGFIQTGGFGICFLITVLLPSSASVPWSFFHRLLLFLSFIKGPNEASVVLNGQLLNLKLKVAAATEANVTFKIILMHKLD